MQPTHLIQKQMVEVQLNGTETEALALQREVAELCENHLPRAMEEVLNLYDNAENDTIIDYLTITVNGLSAGGFSEAFLSSVTTQLAAVLQSRALPESRKHPAPAHDGNLIVYKRDAQVVEIESRVELVFFHFLRTGVLLWWTSPDQVKSWEAAVLNLLSASPATLTGLRQLLLQHPAARQRFLLQFSYSWQQTVLSALAPAAYAQTAAVRQILQAVLPTPLPDGFKTWQMDAVLQESTALFPLLQLAVVQMRFREDNVIRALTVPQLAARLRHAKLPFTHSPDELATAVFEALEQPLAVEHHTPDIQPHTPEEPYYIHNAGLILLAPFIPQLLRNCGAADNTGILHEGYAAALLEYLATARTGVPEHEMIFNKILCGMAAGKPIALVHELAAEHISEAEELLRSVIDNWPVLKSTSINGLRASFLQRPGKLSLKDEEGNWLLQVERESYDEWLLGELPWGYHMTAVPYGPQKKLIWTEWI